jgi:citrate lyase beta subunit
MRRSDRPPPRIRSLLFAPAIRPDILAKLTRTKADAFVIDCEDAVPLARKVEARAMAREWADTLTDRGLSIFVPRKGPPSPVGFKLS